MAGCGKTLDSCRANSGPFRIGVGFVRRDAVALGSSLIGKIERIQAIQFFLVLF